MKTILNILSVIIILYIACANKFSQISSANDNYPIAKYLGKHTDTEKGITYDMFKTPKGILLMCEPQQDVPPGQPNMTYVYKDGYRCCTETNFDDFDSFHADRYELLWITNRRGLPTMGIITLKRGSHKLHFRYDLGFDGKAKWIP